MELKLDLDLDFDLILIQIKMKLELELGAGAGPRSGFRFHFQLVACASHGFPLVEGGALTLKGFDGMGHGILWVTLRGLQESRIS